MSSTLAMIPDTRARSSPRVRSASEAARSTRLIVSSRSLEDASAGAAEVERLGRNAASSARIASSSARAAEDSTWLLVSRFVASSAGFVDVPAAPAQAIRIAADVRPTRAWVAPRWVAAWISTRPGWRLGTSSWDGPGDVPAPPSASPPALRATTRRGRYVGAGMPRGPASRTCRTTVAVVCCCLTDASTPGLPYFTSSSWICCLIRVRIGSSSSSSSSSLEDAETEASPRS